jgi:hypothetical protein
VNPYSLGGVTVKPLYVRFVREKESGRIPASTTWKQYQAQGGAA